MCVSVPVVTTTGVDSWLGFFKIDTGMVVTTSEQLATLTLSRLSAVSSWIQNEKTYITMWSLQTKMKSTNNYYVHLQERRSCFRLCQEWYQILSHFLDALGQSAELSCSFVTCAEQELVCISYIYIYIYYSLSTGKDHESVANIVMSAIGTSDNAASDE